MSDQIEFREPWPDELPRIHTIFKGSNLIPRNASFIVGIASQPIEHLVSVMAWTKKDINSITILPRSAGRDALSSDLFASMLDYLLEKFIDTEFEVLFASILSESHPFVKVLDSREFKTQNTQRSFLLPFWALKERISRITESANPPDFNYWELAPPTT